MKPKCAQLLMGCHPRAHAWIHHTGNGGGALGVALFLLLLVIVVNKCG